MHMIISLVVKYDIPFCCEITPFCCEITANNK